MKKLLLILGLVATASWSGVALQTWMSQQDPTAYYRADGSVEAIQTTIGTRDDPDPIKCGRPCVIEFSPGGDLLTFRLQAQRLRAEHVPIIVDGMCASACTAFLDEQREDVCVTTHAILGFHQGYAVSETVDKKTHVERFQVAYSTDITAWIKDHGGLPTDDLLVAGFDEAVKLFKPCPGAY